MNKVTFKENVVLVNGVEVARMEGRSEVYITMKDAEGEFKVVARFKYKSPKACAKHWLKTILTHMTSASIVEALKTIPGVWPGMNPTKLAEQFGYVHLNVQKALKIQAEQERLKNTPVRIMTWAELGMTA